MQLPEGGGEYQSNRTGHCQWGCSHAGLALAKDVLVSDDRLTEHHFPDKMNPKKNCALRSATYKVERQVT